MRGDQLFRRVAVIAAMSMLPSLGMAAGLGKINVLSALGQPLLAEIDLVAVSAEEFPSLAAKLASQDAYREANVDYPSGLGGFRFVIEKRASGQPYLKVVTNQPINEPFLDLLIELNWSSGRLLREYPVLLDPPGYNAAKPEAPAVTPPVVATPEPQAKPAPSVATQTMPTEPPSTAAKPTAPAPDKAMADKAAVDSSDTYGPVRSGETLRQIAESTRPADISLEQMLVALYRENKGAFIGRNMNRMKKGMILKVPAHSEAASVDAKSAKREVVAQTADWNAYRKRLAGAATQGERSGQTASGAIDTKVSDVAAPPETGKDVLKLSKGEAPVGKAGKQAGQEQLNVLQEEVAAREKALEDARSRIAILEGEISKMRQLLELKGTPLPTTKPPIAEKAPVTPPPTAAVTPPAEPSAKPVDTPKPPDTQSQAVPEPPPATPDMAGKPVGEEPPIKPKRPKRITPPPPPPPETGLLDDLMDNPLIPAAGALVLALLGYLGFKQFRKRKDAQLGAFTATKGLPGGFKDAPAVPAPATLTPDAGNSSFLSDFDKVGAGNIDTDEVDPVAEADVYIAYGRDAQAEEILKEANAKDPTRYEIPLKLLEIYANRKSAQSFETVAKQLHGSIGTQHPLWSKVAEMGRKLDADNSLYAPVAMALSGGDRGSESSVIRAIGGGGALAEKPAQLVPAAMKDTLTVKEPIIENAPLDLDLHFDAPPTDTGSAATLSPSTGTLDFDLGESGAATHEDIDFSTGKASSSADPFVLDFDLDTTSPAAANGEAAPSAQPAASTDGGLDFNLDTTPGGKEPVKAAASAIGGQAAGSAVDLPPLDLSEINLNLGAESAGNGAAAGKTGGNWQSAETKLDLARAYLEIGDKVGAVEILQEVLKEGSPEQQEEAKKLAAQA